MPTTHQPVGIKHNSTKLVLTHREFADNFRIFYTDKDVGHFIEGANLRPYYWVCANRPRLSRFQPGA
jgi:hypothetical protein